MRPPVAFIIGCQRSGTYLLGTMIDSHMPVAVPVEPQFIAIFRRYLWLWGDLSKESNRRRLLSAIYEFLEIWTPRSEKGHDLTKIRPQSLLITQPAFDDIVEKAKTYDEMVEAIFGEYARMNGKQLALDKSAYYAFVSPDAMSPRDCKVVHIARDGRDVALSWLKGWWGPQTLHEAAKQWRRHVLEGKAWGLKNPDRYVELRYEDLTANPTPELERVAELLDVPFSGFDAEAHGKSRMVGALAQGETHARISKGIDSKNKDKWRAEMSAEDLRFFEYVAGDALDACGYARGQSAAASSFDRLRWAIRIALSNLQRKLSVRHWNTVIKENLPVPVFIGQALGIPLARLTAPPGWPQAPRREYAKI